VDWTGDVALPASVAVGDPCKAVADPPGKVISGGQVLGCDWPWGNPSGDFATWNSIYPQEPARQHGVRFEGEYVPVGPEGPGRGDPRIYDWRLNVTNSVSTCDWRGHQITPLDHQPFAPDHLGTTNQIMSCPVAQRKYWNDLIRTVCFGQTDNGYYVGGFFTYEPLMLRSNGGLQSPTSTLLPQPCPRCGGQIRIYEVLAEAWAVVPPWRTWIEIADWREKNDADVFPGTRKAWEKSRNLTLTHEDRHKADYKRLFVDVVNLRYARYYCKYQAAYCVNANPNHANMADDDLTAMIDMRRAAFVKSYQDASAFKAASGAFDAVDYDAMAKVLADYAMEECGCQLGGLPLWDPK
jgi:hypothetical protein